MSKFSEPGEPSGDSAAEDEEAEGNNVESSSQASSQRLPHVFLDGDLKPCIVVSGEENGQDLGENEDWHDIKAGGKTVPSIKPKEKKQHKSTSETVRFKQEKQKAEKSTENESQQNFFHLENSEFDGERWRNEESLFVELGDRFEFSRTANRLSRFRSSTKTVRDVSVTFASLISFDQHSLQSRKPQNHHRRSN